MAEGNEVMSYLIYFGIVAAAGGGLMLVSTSFIYEISRGVEAVFDRVEYRLALRARERESFRREPQVVNVTPFRASETQRIAKGSTQPLGVARIAA